MFIVLTTVYIFIIFIVLFGDYKGKEIEKHKKEWERITGKKAVLVAIIFILSAIIDFIIDITERISEKWKKKN